MDATKYRKNNPEQIGEIISNKQQSYSPEQSNKIEMTIDGQYFGIIKEMSITSTHEIHSLSLFLNNVIVYYKEWNIDLTEDVIFH